MESKYINVENIEKKPKLFLKIYSEWSKFNNYQVREIYPVQELADIVLKDCKDGFEYAQFLKLPKTEIEIVCEKLNVDYVLLASLLNVRASRLANCISRGKCSKGILKLLKERKWI